MSAMAEHTEPASLAGGSRMNSNSRPSDWSSTKARASRRVARELDLVASALGQWVKQAQADRSKGPHRPDDRRARGAGAAPQRESDPPGRAGHPKKSDGVLREAEPMRFAFIAAKKAEHRVTILCRCMRVTRSGFYAWRRRGLSARAQRDLVLRTKLRAFHAASGERYGRPRLWKDLREDGEAVSEKRVGRLMREEADSGPGPEAVQADDRQRSRRSHRGQSAGS